MTVMHRKFMYYVENGLFLEAQRLLHLGIVLTPLRNVAFAFKAEYVSEAERFFRRNLSSKFQMEVFPTIFTGGLFYLYFWDKQE